MLPLTVEPEIVPLPATSVQAAAVALPPIVPLIGIVAGSQTAKSTPALTVATGLIVTVTVDVGPLQALAVGVMVYTTVPIDALVVLNIWLIVEPFPLVDPVTFPVGAAVQSNVVPATFFGDGRIFITAAAPLQIITLDAVAEGRGFTVTTKSTGKPSHPLKAGIIRYVTVPETLPLF